MNFNERLKSLIEEKGVSIKEVSKATKISPVMIVKYINNQASPKITTILPLLSYFNVTLDYLLGLSDRKN